VSTPRPVASAGNHGFRSAFRTTAVVAILATVLVAALAPESKPPAAAGWTGRESHSSP
jgi:hypothetical protein